MGLDPKRSAARALICAASAWVLGVCTAPVSPRSREDAEMRSGRFRWGNGWGLTGSSLAFGLAHTGWGNTADSVQASLAGAYLGWMQQRNGFQIGEGVALHYWINLLAGISPIRHGGSAQLLSLTLPFN